MWQQKKKKINKNLNTFYSLIVWLLNVIFTVDKLWTLSNFSFFHS